MHLLPASRLAAAALHRAPVPRALQPPPPRAAATWGAWGAYMAVVLFSEGGVAPGNSALHTEPETIREALDLSLNFWFVLPVVLPALAPTLDPSLEAIFNVLICWALLFFGFSADERENTYTGGMVPYLTGALFLTNVFYLPMLALRTPAADAATRTAAPLTPVQRVGESRLLAVLVGVLVPLISVCWFAAARAEAFPPGLEARWDALVDLVRTDRLAFSFAADYLVFALFQGVLVPDDAARRGVEPSAAAVRAARFVPFFGLVAWLLTRPALAAEGSEEP